MESVCRKGDSRVEKQKKFDLNSNSCLLYILLQWTWGILQNLIGLGIFLWHIKSRHFLYHGAVATEWASEKFSLGMGMFIFMRKPREGEDITDLPKSGDYVRVLVHEYGHTIQSIILGPLYLLVISIPSGLWCNLPQAAEYRRKNKVSYYEFYPEKWADHLGEKKLKFKINDKQS